MSKSLVKIRVAIIYDDLNNVMATLHKLAPNESDIVRRRSDLVETNLLIIHLIKAGDQLLGMRLDFIYTTKEIANSEWFDKVIRPMMFCRWAELCES